MTVIDIEKLNQLISRTDISGNDKVRWLTGFIDGREFQQQEQDKKMYSEEEVFELLNNLRLDSYSNGMGRVEFLEWFEQYKKK